MWRVPWNPDAMASVPPSGLTFGRFGPATLSPAEDVHRILSGPCKCSATVFDRHDPLADELSDLRHYGVAEGSDSVHPSGNPMSHSTHVGFNCPLTRSRSGRELP